MGLQPVALTLPGVEITTCAVGKIVAVAVGIRVQAQPPRAADRQTDEVILPGRIAAVHHDHDIISGAVLIPALEHDHVLRLVEVGHPDVLTAEPAAVALVIETYSDRKSVV